jgi:heme exporter protein B
MNQIKNILTLSLWEFTLQNNINSLIKYFFSFLFFCNCSIVLISSYQDIQKIGLLFAIVTLPLSLLGASNLIFKQDIEDGYLENLLSNFSSFQIVLAKFFSLLVSGITGVVLNIPIIFLMFSLSFSKVTSITYTLILLLITSCSLIMVISSIQGYFRSNTSFLSILITPLLIPSIILAGLILQTSDDSSLLFIMIGINLIILPISLFLSSYLIKNIYNI